MSRPGTGNTQRGVTLIELMVVVAIIAIISAVAYPSYERYVVRTKRAVAQNALVQVADRQQQFFMDNKRYAADLTNLGYAANPFVVDDNGSGTVAGDPDAVYSIALSNVTATTWTATAAPVHAQLARDTHCASLTLTQAGAKGSSAGATDCW
jgi:type IV pilus assembly protein PilE